MKLDVFAVYDEPVGAFMKPFFARTKGEAIRSFGDAVNGNQQEQMAMHYKSYALFHLGTYDDNSGIIVANPQPVAVVTGFDVKVKE